jgi:TolA-binding protein
MVPSLSLLRSFPFSLRSLLFALCAPSFAPADAVIEPHKALEQYQIAQTENPMHENSLFNQAGLYAEVLHDNQQAVATAREFLKRFPQSDRAAAARQLISTLEVKDQSPGKP